VGNAVDAITDAVTDVIGAVIDVVTLIWQESTVPILEDIFGVFGIEDETVVSVSKISIAVLGDDPNNIVKGALSKTAIDNTKNGIGFYKNYVSNFNKHKNEIRSFYNFGKGTGYVYGLPTMTIKSINVSSSGVKDAIDADLGGTFTVITSSNSYPTPIVFIKHSLQSAPYNYITYLDTLTKDAANGVSYSDWSWYTVDFDETNFRYDVSVRRIAEITQVFLNADEVYVNEGSTVSVTATTNRAVPAGQTLTLDLSYSGATASEFSAPATVSITAGNTSATFNVAVSALASSKRLNVTVDAAPTPIYENISVWEAGLSTSVVLIPSGDVSLAVGQLSVKRGNTVTIPVKLSGTASGSFTVDWATSSEGNDSDATPDSDYTESSGTLTFAGTAGEIQNITVDTFGTFSFYPSEPFNIVLSNCSNGAVVDTVTGVVRITNDVVALPSSSSALVTEQFIHPSYPEDRHVVATYHESSAPSSEWFYWLYKLDDNTYPEVDPQVSNTTDLEMLPVAIIRKNKQSINQVKDEDAGFLEDFGVETEIYKSTRNIFRRVNLNLPDVIDTIEENPDIDEIDDVYVNFAMDPSNNNKILSKLLWLHMYEIIVVRSVVSNNGKYAATFEEQDVNNALAWTDFSYIENVSIFDTVLVSYEEFNALKIGEFIHAISGINFYMYKKVSEFNVDQLKIVNLSGMNAIAYEGYHNMAFNVAGSAGFTMPVSWYVINKLNGPEILEVFPYIFRLDIFSLQVTELNWYETSAFKTFFNVVMIVLAIYSLGTTLIADGFWAAVGQTLFNFAVVEIVVYIAELTGNPELAAAIGIIATVVIGSKMGMKFDISSAEGLTNVVTAFSTNLGAAQSGELNALGEDLTDLMAEFEKQQELIDEYNEENESKVFGGAEHWSLRNSDAHFYEAGPIQFNFDLLFDYDNLVSNYFDQQLTVSI
jgi:hypothetical protein